MAMAPSYQDPGPALEEVKAIPGPLVLEFGASWCPHCSAAQPLMAANLAGRPRVRLIRVEDGRGRPLGRSFQVKLWPTFIFLNEGQEVARLVRPATAQEIGRALDRIDLETF